MKKLSIIYAWLLFALFLYLTGCKTPEVVTNQSSDRSTIREQYDSTLTVAGDSATAALLLRCDSLGNLKPQVVYRNQPMYIRVDCKEDSLQLVIKGLRERIEYYEKNDTLRTEQVKYVPDYYKNCTRGFWWLLVILLLIVLWKVADYIPYLKTAKAAIKVYLHL